MSIDFFVVATVRFKVLFVLVVLEHHRRRVVHFNVMEHPTAQWTGQQIIEAFTWDTALKYLLRDRDAIYGGWFQRRVKSMGIEEVLTAPRSPWQKYYVSYCTSWVGSVLSGRGMSLLLGFLPGVFDRRMLAQRFIEVISFAGRGVSFQPAGSAPFLDAGNRDIELLSDFLSGEHTGIAQALIATSQAIGPAQLGDHCGMERLAGAGA